MATFTIEFHEVLESPLDLGLDTVPLFDENYRERFVKLITERYYWREICTTPAPRFAWFFRRKLNEIMPYYNEMYRTTVLEVNPLAMFASKTTAKTVNSASGTSESTSKQTEGSTATATSKARTLGSTTPVTQLQGNEDYATALTDNDAASETDTTGTSESDNSGISANEALTDYVTETSGYQGNVGWVLQQYRESLTNVDTALLDELNVLFYPIYIDTIDLL